MSVVTFQVSGWNDQTDFEQPQDLSNLAILRANKPLFGLPVNIRRIYDAIYLIYIMTKSN